MKIKTSNELVFSQLKASCLRMTKRLSQRVKMNLYQKILSRLGKAMYKNSTVSKKRLAGMLTMGGLITILFGIELFP